jgi:hypothetical protein
MKKVTINIDVDLLIPFIPEAADLEVLPRKKKKKLKKYVAKRIGQMIDELVETGEIKKLSYED